VFERRGVVGGKAASSHKGALPTEHGFRFFPGFYFHVVDTMERIPAADGRGWVADQLVNLPVAIMDDGEGHRLTLPLPTRAGQSVQWEQIKAVWSFRHGMPNPWESLCFLAVLARLACGCEPRWKKRLERQNWLDHVINPKRIRPRSKKFVNVCAVGLTRSLVATRAEQMNAETGGKILLQLLYDIYFGPPVRRPADRVLNGPTSDVWITPWRNYLEGLIPRVQFREGCTVAGLEIRHGRVVDLRLQSEEEQEHLKPGKLLHEQFDWYVLAVPCEVLKQILVNTPPLLELDDRLAGVFRLKTQWMNGIVLGLEQDLDPPLPPAHMICLNSPWAVTLLDQSKIWSRTHLTEVREHWKALVSIDISDWETPGPDGLPAKWYQPPPKELVADLWAQLQKHLPELKGRNPPDNPRDFALDADIQYSTAPAAGIGSVRVARHETDDEPLLINTAGSWKSRPKAKTRVPNLFIAGDFPRTHTNFASMEAANEAARRAVNKLFAAAGHPHECAVQPLEDPDVWWFTYPQRLARKVDTVIFDRRLPLRPPYRLPIAAWTVLGVVAWLTGTSRDPARRSWFKPK
jgi:hypothetical protein